MLKKGKDCICISLTEQVLKVTQIKGSGSSAKVVNVISNDILGLSEADLSKAIQTAVHKLKAKKAEVYCVAPPNIITTKNIEIPSTSAEEIKSIVSLQAGRHTPFSREEIQIGYINLGVHKDNYTKVLLVIANRNLIKTQLGYFEKAGLKVKKILFAPEGLSFVYANALKLKGQKVPTAVIDIDKDSTDFVIFSDSLPISSRNIPIGRSQLQTEGDAARDKLIDELSKTVESYQNEDIDQLPSKYVLTSDDDVTKSISSILLEKLKWECEIVSYLDSVNMSQGVLKKIAADYGDISFLNVTSPALAVNDSQINLMPEEVSLQKSIEDQGREVRFAATLVFTVFVLLSAMLGLRYSFRKAYLKKLINDYKGNRLQVTDLEARSTRKGIVKDYLASRMVSLDVIDELYKSIPKEIYLSSILMDEEGAINIQGISDIASVVFNLGTTLKESELFKSVNIKSTTARKDRGKDVSAFEISLKLKSAVEETENETIQETEE